MRSQPSLLHMTDCCVNLQTGFVSKPDKALGRIRLILPSPARSVPWVRPPRISAAFRLYEDHRVLETGLLMLSYTSGEYLSYRWHPGGSLKPTGHFGHADSAPWSNTASKCNIFVSYVIWARLRVQTWWELNVKIVHSGIQTLKWTAYTYVWRAVPQTESCLSKTLDVSNNSVHFTIFTKINVVIRELFNTLDFY